MAYDQSAGKQTNVVTTDRNKRFQDALDRIHRVLTSTEAAEELKSTWHGSGSDEKKTALKDFKRLLDSGKRVNPSETDTPRGIPMWMVVRTVKSSWHADGSWPLLGSDESLPSSSSGMDIPSSIHPRALLLRPKGQDRFELPPSDIAVGEIVKQDPEPDRIAEAYRARGVQNPSEIVTSEGDVW
ncbi:unnamed protein product [Sympodiomycopsis kandeliae]